MIAWSIEAAKASGCFERVIVSTDDEEIAKIARTWGAEVPFMRPPELANDHAPTRPVINHAIQELASASEGPEAVCFLYPTAPFVLVEDLRCGYEILTEQKAKFVFTAAAFASPIQRAFRQTKTGGLERVYPEHRNTRTQDLQETFHDAGQFYWGLAQAFLDNLDMVSDHSRAFVLPSFRVHDIDTPEDWLRAETVFAALFPDGKA